MWTEEQLNNLTILLQTETRQDAADALGKSLCSIKRAIKRHGIKYPKKTGLNYKITRAWPEDFTPEQKEVLVGSLLGDGMITRACPRYRIKQCETFREYVEFQSAFFTPYMTGQIHNDTGMCRGKVVHAALCQTHNAPRFVELRKKWYPKGKKIVPRDIRLTPLTCAHWHVQDGQNRQTKREIILNTNSFTKEDVEFLVERLHEDVSIKCHARKKDKLYWIIVVGNQYGDEGYFQFLDLVRPFVTWNCFQYKSDISGADKRADRPGPKLNYKLAQEIRALHRTGKYRQRELGVMYNVSQSCIWAVINDQSFTQA